MSGRLLLIALLFPAGGCAALQTEMVFAENAYDEAHYDDALVWLSDIEDDVPDMDDEMRARFYFVRGMTAYRLGKRDDALYYLSVAREVAGEEQSSPLGPSWHQTMERTLTELTPESATFRARAEVSATTATP
jgi:hypothetical protein